jgi:guanylate kinase
MGKLIVISGPSGVGKGTVLGIAMKARNDLRFSVSATTRDPRPDEKDGVHYHFINRERFEEMISAGEFLEYSEHNKNYYGTPRGQALEKMEQGHALLDIEPNGAGQVKKNMPEAILIFIMPPSVEELERRLRGRGDTPEDQIEIRLKRAIWEMDQRGWYDHVLVNDDAERCAEEILKIIADKA